LVVPLINEAEKLDNKMEEEQFKVTYFMASDELRKAEEEHKKHGAPIGRWGGMGGRQANGTNRNEEGQTEKSAAATGEPSAAAAAGPQQTHGQRRPTPIFAKLYLGNKRGRLAIGTHTHHAFVQKWHPTWSSCPG
jgi:hypothetical protein